MSSNSTTQQNLLPNFEFYYPEACSNLRQPHAINQHFDGDLYLNPQPPKSGHNSDVYVPTQNTNFDSPRVIKLGLFHGIALTKCVHRLGPQQLTNHSGTWY